MAKQTEQRCITPTCKRRQRSRGLCHSCYNVACKLVWGGKTTWEKLEAAGKALPSKTNRGPGHLTSHFLEDPKPPS